MRGLRSLWGWELFRGGVKWKAEGPGNAACVAGDVGVFGGNGGVVHEFLEGLFDAGARSEGNISGETTNAEAVGAWNFCECGEVGDSEDVVAILVELVDDFGSDVSAFIGMGASPEFIEQPESRGSRGGPPLDEAGDFAAKGGEAFGGFGGQRFFAADVDDCVDRGEFEAGGGYGEGVLGGPLADSGEFEEDGFSAHVGADDDGGALVRVDINGLNWLVFGEKRLCGAGFTALLDVETGVGGPGRPAALQVGAQAAFGESDVENGEVVEEVFEPVDMRVQEVGEVNAEFLFFGIDQGGDGAGVEFGGFEFGRVQAPLAGFFA